MTTFSRPVFALFTAVAFSALTFASGCAVDANDTDGNEPANGDSASQDQALDPVGRLRPNVTIDPVGRLRPNVTIDARDEMNPRLDVPVVLGDVIDDETTPALIEMRDQCKRASKHWSLTKHVCMAPDSLDAKTDACVFDGGIMKDGGCTFGGPAQPPAKLGPQAPKSPMPTTPVGDGSDLALPKAPVAVGCAKAPCE